MHTQEQQKTPLKPLKQRSISMRLRWSYLLSSTIPLILVGLLLITLNFRTQQKSVYNEQLMLAIQAVREIGNYVGGIEAQLLSAGQQMDAETSTQEWETRLRELIHASYPDLRSVSVFNMDGMEIAQLSQERTFSADSFIRSTEDPMVEKALDGLGSRSDIQVAEDGKNIFIIALPLRNIQAKPIGAIRAEVSATPIEQSLRLIGRGTSSVAFLINDTPEMMLSGAPTGWKPPELNEALKSDAEDIEYLRENSRAMVYKNGLNEQVLGIMTPITPGTWSVIVEQPIKVAFGNVWNTMLLLGILVALVGLLALGVGLFQAQKFLRPLRLLREGAEAFGAGKLDHCITVSTGDEMEQLAVTFNQMAERLQASLSEIEDQNTRLREGLQLARDIQMGLLPSRPPWDQDSLTVHAMSVPASEVGGDFYSYLALPEYKAAISIGDISGKGVGAALMMALTSSMIESQARDATQPSEVLGGLNQHLHYRLKSNRMNAAMLYAVFDLRANTMTVANAGMIAPLLIRKNHTWHMGNGGGLKLNKEPATPYISEFLDVGGLPIGSLPEIRYQNITIPFDSEDIILFMSDGVIEAHNQQGEMFGFERLDDLLSNAQELHTVQDFVHFLLNSVQDFMGDAEQHDDITIVAVRPAVELETEERRETERNRYATV
jgi:serine phosphatase RsbU (regulator of sigma subunit)